MDGAPRYLLPSVCVTGSSPPWGRQTVSPAAGSAWFIFVLCCSERRGTRSLPKMVKLDIHTLAHHLKQERLYVNSEKQLIQRLNADVLKTAEKLYRTAWISKQQRINLDRLIITR